MYFIDDEIYFKGEKQPPRKVKLPMVKKIDDEMAQCFDEDGNEYMLEVSKIYDDD